MLKVQYTCKFRTPNHQQREAVIQTNLYQFRKISQQQY